MKFSEWLKKIGIKIFSVILIILLAIGSSYFDVIKDKDDDFEVTEYSFYSKTLENDHFKKHGIKMGYNNSKDYVYGANLVISNPKSLHKLEREDGDDVYYLVSSNEFVIVSKDGYIRTYFEPDDGINYFNRQ